eukprot:COSAG05_NODE_340_length_11109_cov_150.755041_7_plen_170_part_00
MFVKPQSFGNGLRSVVAFRATTFAGAASRGDLWLHRPGSTSSMGYFRILLHRRDRTDPPFQDRLAADQVGRRATDPRNYGASLSIADFSGITRSKGVRMTEAGWAPTSCAPVLSRRSSCGWCAPSRPPKRGMWERETPPRHHHHDDCCGGGGVCGPCGHPVERRDCTGK